MNVNLINLYQNNYNSIPVSDRFPTCQNFVTEPNFRPEYEINSTIQTSKIISGLSYITAASINHKWFLQLGRTTIKIFPSKVKTKWKMYSFSDQNGQNLFPFQDQNQSKTIPFWLVHNYKAHLRKYPPPLG